METMAALELRLLSAEEMNKSSSRIRWYGQPTRLPFARLMSKASLKDGSA